MLEWYVDINYFNIRLGECDPSGAERGAGDVGKRERGGVAGGGRAGRADRHGGRGAAEAAHAAGAAARRAHWLRGHAGRG